MEEARKLSKKKQFLAHLKKGNGIISYACDTCKISRRTYYNWYNSDKKFKDECDDVLESVLDVVESKLLSKINDADTTAIIFYLKTKGKKRGYIEQIDTRVQVNPFEELMKSLPDPPVKK